MYKIMVLFNNSPETILSVFTKFDIGPSVEMGLRVCSIGHAPLTVMPMYGKKIIKKKNTFFKTKNCSNDDPFISCNDRMEKCCITVNICISAVAILFR